MRKYLIMLLSVLLIMLAACGNEEVQQEPNNDEVMEENEEETNESEEVEMDDNGMLEQTADPLEAGNKSNGVNVFEDEWSNIYLVKKWYSNDDTDEEGFNTMDFDGYEVKFSVVLLEDENEDEVIGFFVETENNTDKLIQYNMDMELLTDEQEQAYPDDMYGIGESKPDIKTKGFTKVNLDYDTPDSFEVTFEPPWDDESEFDDAVGESIETEFEME